MFLKKLKTDSKPFKNMSKTLTLQQYLIQIPKAELHLHIEGTLEPELMFSLAKRNGVQLPFQSIAEVHQAYHFKDLQSFLDLYYAGMKVLLHEQDFFDLTWSYLKQIAKQNVRHVEIFFDPQAHLDRGVVFATVIDGISKALKKAESELKISSHVIMCFLRDLSEASALQTFEQALPFKNKIIGIGLDSAELGNPPEKFKKVFAKAREAGLLACAHAGEEGPPEYIWQALDILKVQRIDHGVKCVLDEKLIQHLAQTQIPLTVCPISNIRLCVYASMQQHPLKKMLEAGLCATVNSDDPAYFGAYVAENFIAVYQALGLTQEDVYQLAKNSFNASFLQETQKQKFISELDQFVKNHALTATEN